MSAAPNADPLSVELLSGDVPKPSESFQGP